MSKRLWASALAAPALLAARLAAAPAASAWPEVQAEISAATDTMVDAPQAALGAARLAESRAKEHPASPERERALATAGWLQGEALIRVNRPAEALPAIGAALARVQAVAPGGKLEGDLLKARGNAAAAQERVQPALADFQSAYRVYQRAGLARSQALVLQDIGRIYSDANDHAHSVINYTQTTEIYTDDPSLTLAARNNLGWSYLGLKRDADALAQFELALKLARGLGSRLMEVRVLPNLALAQLRLGRTADAEATLATALAIARTDPGARSFEADIWEVKAPRRWSTPSPARTSPAPTPASATLTPRRGACTARCTSPSARWRTSPPTSGWTTRRATSPPRPTPR